MTGKLMHSTSHKSVYFILLITLITVSLAGCAKSAEDSSIGSEYDSPAIFSDGRPSIGPTVENETVTNVDIESQTRISLKIRSGSIKLTCTDQGQLQIIEKWWLKGPTSQERLKELLEESKKTLETTSMSINIEREANEEPLYRQTVQMELIVPEAIKQIDIDAENSSIQLSGFDEMHTIDLRVGKGAVDVEQCSSKRFGVSVDEGNIRMKDILGFGLYECGRGDILLSRVKGAVELKSVSGNTLIEESEGKLYCDISTGSLTVKDSDIGQDSMLYASSGSICADFAKAGIMGGCKLMAAKGDIQLNLPKDGAAWSLVAKSTKGRVKDKMDPKPETLETLSSGEVHCDVGGGGPLIDIYVDDGDITLE